MDEGETPEEAAIRELEEETGFKATQVVESTSTLHNDPGAKKSLTFYDDDDSKQPLILVQE